MKSVLKTSFLLITFLAFTILLSSCSDDSSDVPGTARVQISIVDVPGDFDSVIIDVEDVFINVSGSGTGWETLDDVNPGSYDLLKLVNGNEWLIGETELPEGNLSQIRLVLGSGNRLYIGDSAVFLPVPSANKSGLKINVQEYLDGGLTYKLVLDFDVDKSVVRLGNGDYNLKPVIRGNLEAKSGAIKGRVLPDNQKYRVFAVRSIDTFNTYTNRNGEFVLRALEPGIYDLTIPNDSGIDLTISEIAIRAGEVKDLGDLRLP